MRKNTAREKHALRACPICGGNDARDWLQAPDRFHGRTQLYRLLRCPSCSLVWTDQPPRPEEMSYHYGPDYDRMIGAAGEASPDRWRKRRETLAKYKSGGALLDLGCSSGSFLESLKDQSWSLSGIEISPECAQKAEMRSGARVFTGDILAAPFPPASFDAVTCFHVFEHLYEPRTVLQRVTEWLKPDGIFYTIVPNIDSAGARVFGSYWYALELPRHLFHFSPLSLRHLARLVALQEASITTHRELFIESSIRYICDDLFRKIGVPKAPLARAKGVGVPWRAFRKLWRIAVFPLISLVAYTVGDGESIHVILRKEAA